jgi:carbamoyl-phosphate synthase small subunit
MSDIGLCLADDTFWPGISVGAPGAAVGEAVFTTAMTGYQEALTDPSFARQILAFSAPMIGNYGVEDDASESRRVQPTALICHEACSTGCAREASWRSRGSTPAPSCATCATAGRCSPSPAARA